ncbi:MAG TPA: ABC transporter substrate-binding protein [Candidatus Limnocylindria bacterium]|nr:ABC transporter substrate-binding protein [Candidatus Limnocylindria bacterium]
MKRNLIFFVGLFLVIILAAPASAQLRKVRFSVSAASIAEVPFRIAQVKGFYREEGLDLEVIMIRGAVGMQALLGGSVDFTSASGSTIAAAVRGLPVKLVFIASAKPQFDLIALKEIRSVADLKGKNVGISSRGGAVDLLTQLIVQKNGLIPNKDVISLVVGGQEDTVLALRTGRIAAALLTPPRPLILQREGFNRIAYSGDYMPTYPSGGIGVTDEKLKTAPNDVLAFVKGSVRGLQFARQNRAEAMKILAGYFSIKDQGLTEEFFDLYLSRLPADGSADETWMKGAIDFTQKSLPGAPKEVPTSQVFDFSFVRKAPR